MKKNIILITLIVVIGICLASCEDVFDYRKPWVGKYQYEEYSQYGELNKKGTLTVSLPETGDSTILIGGCKVPVSTDGYFNGPTSWGKIKGNFDKNFLIYTEISYSRLGTTASVFHCKKIKNE